MPRVIDLVAGNAYAPGADVTRGRDRPCLVNVAGSPTMAGLDAERVLRFRVGFASGPEPASAVGGAVSVTDGIISAAALRPTPSALAVLEHCSE